MSSFSQAATRILEKTPKFPVQTQQVAHKENFTSTTSTTSNNKLVSQY